MARQARTLSAGWNYGRKESIIILIILELRISLPLLRAAAGRRAGREENEHVKRHKAP